jgi:hypothetical protein
MLWRQENSFPPPQQMYRLGGRNLHALAWQCISPKHAAYKPTDIVRKAVPLAYPSRLGVLDCLQLERKISLIRPQVTHEIRCQIIEILPYTEEGVETHCPRDIAIDGIATWFTEKFTLCEAPHAEQLSKSPGPGAMRFLVVGISEKILHLNIRRELQMRPLSSVEWKSKRLCVNSALTFSTSKTTFHSSSYLRGSLIDTAHTQLST